MLPDLIHLKNTHTLREKKIDSLLKRKRISDSQRYFTQFIKHEMKLNDAHL